MKKRKLLEKVLSGSKNIRFEEFVILLLGFGFELKRVNGSHQVFKHPSVLALLSVQPTGSGQAKPYQVRQFLKLVEEFNLRLNEDEA